MERLETRERGVHLHTLEDRDAVDAEELGQMGLASVLLADVGLERAVGRSLKLPQLTGKSRAAHLVR